jgi:fatty-acyl-CoA synthase
VQTWSEMVAYHAARRPDSPCISDSSEAVTYSQLSHRMARRASWLAARGVLPGSRVGILGRNSVLLVEALLACQHLGAVSVPLNFRLAADEIAYMLKHSESCLLVADTEFRQLAGDAAGQRVPVTVLSPAAELASLPESPPAAADPGDICRIMYTSGTTSRPKGVVLTNKNIFVKCVAESREFGLSYTDRGLIVGPLFHIAALDVTLTNANYVGGSVDIMSGFDAGKTLDVLLAGRITHVWLAPVMLRRVLDIAEKSEITVEAGPRLIIGGGEPSSPELIERISAVFPQSWYANVYGLTETSTGDTVLPPGQARLRPGSVGLPVAAAEVIILDAGGHPCPARTTGQVAIGGDKLSPGYWQDPEATAASRQGLLFLTGDAGYLDDEGYLVLTGRIKDMILSGGENIAAAEIERVLLEHPSVLEAAVIGRPDHEWGEVPVAYVISRPGSVPEQNELSEHCRAKLGRLKVPKEYRLVASLPRTSIGKVQKGLLRQWVLTANEGAVPSAP